MNQSESSSLHASTSFSNTLAQLGGLVRLALREVEGEGVDSDDFKDSDPFEAEGYRVGSPSGIGPSSLAESSLKRHGSAKRAKTGYGSAPSRDPRWYGTGGYTGVQGDPEAEKAERALQARTEEERLRKENETLRELLRISTDITPQVAREFDIEIPAPTTSTSWSSAGLNAGKLSLGKARGNRKSIIEAILPVKSTETKTSDSAVKTEDDQEAVPDKESIMQDLTLSKSSWPKTETAPSIDLISPSNLADTKTSTEVTSTSPARSIGYVVEGSGGPPQLIASTDEQDADKITGIIATSQVDDIEKDKIEELEAVKMEKELPEAVNKQHGLQDADVGMWQADEATMEAVEEDSVKESSEAGADTAEDKVNLRSKMLDELEETIQQIAAADDEKSSTIE